MDDDLAMIFEGMGVWCVGLTLDLWQFQFGENMGKMAIYSDFSH